MQRYTVKCNGVTYDHISAIIYRAENGRIVVSAELMDKTRNSVTIAQSRFILKEDV